MGDNDTLLLIGAGVAGWILYNSTKGIKDTTTAVGDVATGVGTNLTNPQGTGIVDDVSHVTDVVGAFFKGAGNFIDNQWDRINNNNNTKNVAQDPTFIPYNGTLTVGQEKRILSAKPNPIYQFINPPNPMQMLVQASPLAVPIIQGIEQAKANDKNASQSGYVNIPLGNVKTGLKTGSTSIKTTSPSARYTGGIGKSTIKYSLKR